MRVAGRDKKGAVPIKKAAFSKGYLVYYLLNKAMDSMCFVRGNMSNELTQSNFHAPDCVRSFASRASVAGSHDM